MPDKLRVPDADLAILLNEWDRLWSAWRFGDVRDPIFKRIPNPNTSDLPPISGSSTLQERAQRQDVFDRRLREVGLKISVAAHERGFQTEALDKLLELPTWRDFRLHNPIGIVIDKLRVLTAVQSHPELTDTEQNIVDAIGSERLTGEAVAKKLHYPCNSSFKATLSSLRKRGVLDNLSPGYVVVLSNRKSGQGLD